MALSANAKERLRFENAVRETQSDIEDRIETHIALLRASTGLFAANDRVSREQFRAFVNRLRLQERYSGMQGIGFSVRVQPQAKNALIASMRQQGVENFSIRPNFKRREYHAIIYLEPAERRNRAAIGYDMFTEPTRRSAMSRARDTGLPAASGKVTLIQEIEQQKQAGFLIYLPVYRGGNIPDTVAQRRATLLGFVYSPFRADDLMRRIFDSEQSRLVDFQIYDGKNLNPKNLLHSSHPNKTNFSSQEHSTTTTIDIAGRPWTIVFTSRPELELTGERGLVPYIAFVGVASSLVLFGVTYLLARAKNVAEQSAALATASEAALRESEKRFRRLVESNIFGVSFSDFNGSIHYANDYFLRLLGYEQEDLLAGKVRWDEITPAEFLHLDAQAAAELKERGVCNPYEKEYIRKNGSRVPILIGAALLQEAQQQEIIGFILDLSDRVSAEAALRQSEERYRTFIQQSSEGIWRFELEQPLTLNRSEDEQIQHFYQYGYLAECNDVMAQMYGFSRAEELNGVRLSQLLVDSEPLNIEYLHRFIRSGYKLNAAESYEVDKEGKPKYFLNNLVGIVKDNFLIQAWGTQLDITERKVVQEALRYSEERYRSLVEATSQIIWNTNAAGEIDTPQPAWSAFTGQRFEELQGWGWLNAVHPSDRDHVAQVWSDAVTNHTLYEVEHRLRRNDGEYRYMSVRGVPVVESDGRIREWVGVHADITERKLAEAEREQLLEREQAARQEAEKANRMKDEFLATLSHELRTPLNAMLGWTQLLRSRKFNEATTARALETIDRNTKSLAQLIEDVLDVSRIITGKLRLNVRPVELAPIIQAAIETVLPAACAKQIHIESIVHSSAATKVLGDATRLQQVFWNLLSNAVKFTPQGGQITVHLEIVNSQIQVRVSDTGQGISPDFLPYVFDRFRQADSSITRVHGGLGLGLAIVRHLVELHGGTVRVESQGLGKGATFIVNLPIEAVADELRPEQVRSQVTHQAPQISSRSLNGLRILVVDDEPDARELLATAIEQHGAEVKVADSAAQALKAIEAWHPDILVSDIGMPEEDGYSLIRQLRNLEQQQGGNIPAVALTAYARPEDRTQALAAGFQLHVAKPVDVAQLVEVVGSLAERSQNS